MLSAEPQVLHEDAATRLRESTAKIAVVGPSGRGKTVLLGQLDGWENLIPVVVPHSPDQIERTILDLGAALGEHPQEKAAEALRLHFDDPEPALEILGGALGNRRLVVDDFDAIFGPLENRELSDLMAPSRRSLARWLRRRAAVIATKTPPPKDWNFDLLTLEPSDVLPWRVQGHDRETHELWGAAKREPESYRLALAHLAVTGQLPDPAALCEPDALARTIWEAAPAPVCELMAWLACYRAPFPKHAFERLVAESEEGEWALRYALDALLVEHGTGKFWLSPQWQALVPKFIESRAIRQAHHRRLADFFAELTHAKFIDPRWIQAAHRHYLQAGDRSRATDFVKFGASLLLEAGRLASHEHTYDLATEYYDSVLTLDERLRRESSKVGVGARIRGYATHYCHYNRYKGGREDIRQTERGYARSVQDYPENALFWSRLIVARFHQGHWSDALTTRDQAHRSVKSESAIEKYLLGRTVLKLIDRQLVNAAIVIWGDARRVSEGKAVQARYRLAEHGKAGWQARVLRVPSLPDTNFERDVIVELHAEGDGFRCRIKDCRIDGSGTSMLAALRAAIEGLRTELAELERSSADVLNPTQRMRKRELSSLVDELESEILGPGPSHRWLTGQLRHHGDRLLFYAVGSIGEHYELDESIDAPADPGEAFFVARVNAGRGGVPIGPVVELDALVKSPEELEDARRKLDELLGSGAA